MSVILPIFHGTLDFAYLAQDTTVFLGDPTIFRVIPLREKRAGRSLEMKPHRHARNSVKKFGGVPEDYLNIHNFMDVSKSAHADMRHRAVFHNPLGPYVVERVFGMPLAMHRIRNLREKRGWTQQHLADAAFLSRKIITRLEKGELIPAHTLTREKRLAPFNQRTI